MAPCPVVAGPALVTRAMNEFGDAGARGPRATQIRHGVGRFAITRQHSVRYPWRFRPRRGHVPRPAKQAARTRAADPQMSRQAIEDLYTRAVD